MIDVKKYQQLWSISCLIRKLDQGRERQVKNGSNVNRVLAQELNKPVMKRFKRRKVSARFGDNIWEADLAEM